MLFIAKTYINYLLHGKTKYYIHSPFIFSFINDVLHDKRTFYFFDEIKKLKVGLEHNDALIDVNDFGAGSKTIAAGKRKVSVIAKKSSISIKYGQLLSHIVNHFQCNTILELGTSLGIGTAYLAAANSKAKIITFEGATALAALAQQNWAQLKLSNIKVVTGNFDAVLPTALSKLNTVNLAFIDGNHSYEPTINYFNQLLKYTTSDSILIFDDIHWSAEMQKAWKEICSHPAVTVTIDLYRLGIVFFRKEQAKENFILYF
jgi:predicted O-methyltransferase YrrM